MCMSVPSPGYRKNSRVSNQVIFVSCFSCIVHLVSPCETNMSFHSWCKNKGPLFLFVRTEMFKLSQAPAVNWDVHGLLVYSQMWHGSRPHQSQTCKKQANSTNSHSPGRHLISKPSATVEARQSTSRAIQTTLLSVWYSPPKKLGSTLGHIF